MLGASLQFGRGHGEDRFYNAAKTRGNHHNYHNPQRPRNNSSGSASPAPVSKGKKAVILESHEPENRVETEELSRPAAVPAYDAPPAEAAVAPCSNLDRFLEHTTPSVTAQYLSKTTMRGLRTCDVEFQPYFVLGDLWESFKEWSVYGAGVPLILDDSDSVVQYYVPYLSGIQLYTEPDRRRSRRPGEESDGDYYRDLSSDGSSDFEFERGLKNSREWSQHHPSGASAIRMDRLSLREKHMAQQEGSSSDDGEVGNSQGRLLFEYLERDPPYCREPLADKISDLACRLPELKTLRSCDLLPSSWISVAWYPIYRIPTGPTLRDLDACFLTFHLLSTPTGGAGSAMSPMVTYPQGVDGVPTISLPVFGLACYKFKGSMWIPSGRFDRQLSLLQAADNWLRPLHVNHPDYQFFSHGTYRR